MCIQSNALETFQGFNFSSQIQTKESPVWNWMHTVGNSKLDQRRIGTYCISSYKTRGFIFSWPFSSKVTVHKCGCIIRTRVLFEGGSYMRKFGS